MSQLPADVLLLIFDLLVPSDKLECMTVCHQWHDIIQHHSLFGIIYVDKEERFNQLIEKVKKDPALGAKVERMELAFMFKYNYEATIIGDLFPNLRDFRFMISSDYDELNKPIEPLESHPWCEKIEKMVDENGDRSAQKLLLSGLCKNLTYISVSGIEDTPVNSFFSALANAPALNTLCLEQYSMTFQDLEMLHDNAPLLHTLSMFDITFTNTLSSSLVINPATLLKVFRCTLVQFKPYSGFNQHLPYISQKYTRLEELALGLDVLWYQYDDDDEVDYDNDINSYENDEVAEQRVIITSYMKTLAPRLKTLLLRIDPFERAVMNAGFDLNILDDVGCRIERLTLETTMTPVVLECLAKTSQVKYIQSLTVDRYYIYQDYSHSIPLQWLSSFTALKELTLFFSLCYKIKGKCTIALTNLLVNLKETQLKSLTLCNVRLEVNDNEELVVYPSLKELTLRFVSFEIGADMRLSQMLPNLKRLNLNSCFKEGGSLMLPNTDLSYLDIKNPRSPIPIMVVTLVDGQHRLYNRSAQLVRFQSDRENGQQDTINAPYVLSQPLLYKSKDTPKLIIVCNSVYNVNVRKYQY